MIRTPYSPFVDTCSHMAFSSSPSKCCSRLPSSQKVRPRKIIPTFSLGYILALEGSGRQLTLPAHHNLPRSPAKGLPIIPAINGFDSKTCRQEQQLEFAWEEDMHIEFGEVTLMLTRFKKLFVRPQ